MPRYLVERTLPGGHRTFTNRDSCRAIVENNAHLGVTWLHSYLASDRAKTFCLYEAPTPEAVRRAAKKSGLPIDAITRVGVIDPYDATDAG